MKACRAPQAILAETSLVESFLTFVKVDTQSDAESDAKPSTARQFDLQKLLRERLVDAGCRDVRLDKQGYLYATFPGNAPPAPAFGLIAHVDTAVDFSGAGVKPRLHPNYAGGPIAISGEVMLLPNENPELAECIGDTIITASGDTLLGADDKAGIAEILAALEYFKKHPDLKRPDLRIAFTPDEEIGRGADYFDVPGFQATCAYTLDGGFAGEVNFETFSADKAVAIFTGVAVHPGTAKGKMVNAIRWLSRFVEALPADECPERTEDRQGFFHPTKIEGNASEAKVEMILRDFDTNVLKVRGDRVKTLADKFLQAEPRLKAHVEITAQYRNMADELARHPRARDLLLAAVRAAGLEPRLIPIRGGTDGSGLTAKGLPTPNIFAGGCNFHGPREWISTRAMALAVCTVVNLAQLFAESV